MKAELTGYVRVKKTPEGHTFSRGFRFYPLPEWANPIKGCRWDVVEMQADVLQYFQPEDGQQFRITVEIID